jgi:ABC-type transport system involved in cytochrome bd biosynthesis fused ATPase/permease subunit
MTLYMRGMVPLRLVALCSNVAFLIYAFSLHLAPIVILHGALIPVNVSRLIAAWRADTRPGQAWSRLT